VGSNKDFETIVPGLTDVPSREPLTLALSLCTRGRRRNLARELADLAPGMTDVMIDMRHDTFGVPLLDRGENRFVGAACGWNCVR
jgi:hypothetical protein